MICTYLRDELLDLTLRSLTDQTADPSQYSVLVVDNAQQTSTRKVAAYYGVSYVVEPLLGHSHARNRGMLTATTPWVLYLDDDVQLPPGLVQQFLMHLMSEKEYAAIGGWFKNWFRDPPPAWVRKYYGEGYRPSHQKSAGELAPNLYLVGCLFAVYRPAWEAVGGFSDEVGMHGLAVGRADEDELQQRLRAAGYRILYDPAIYIYHLVQPYKYTISGQLQLAYATGRDGVGMRGERVINLGELLMQYIRITGYSLPFNLARWLLKPGYHWQNLVVDTMTKYAFSWGQYCTHRKLSQP